MFTKMIKDLVGSSLPCDEAQTEARHKATEVFKQACAIFENAMDGEVVLVVDDDPVDALTIVKALETVEPAGGPDIVTMTSPEAAIDYIETSTLSIRIVVTDMCMGGNASAGMGLVEWVKANHEEIPIVVCTAFQNVAKKVHEKFPDVQVILKGQLTTAQLLLILGMCPQGYASSNPRKSRDTDTGILRKAR